MALRIETFNNLKGGSSFFKAVGHPLAVAKAQELLGRLSACETVAIYDPLGFAEGFSQIHDLGVLPVQGVYVQDVERVGQAIAGHTAKAVTELPQAGVKCVLVAAFDAERLIQQAHHLFPDGAEVVSLDALRLPEDMLSNSRHYLDPLNFATNFAFFRDAGGQHTRLVTANYWAGYGAKETALWYCLFDAEGQVLAQWRENLPRAVNGIVADSREVRKRFGLGEFTGSLFVHALHVAGHDVVKYALDTYGDEDTVLSCTHDANAWPADLYAGLPAPGPGERVLLWVQNSHPLPIPPGGVGMNLMGAQEVAWFDETIPAFATRALEVGALLPQARWPQQVEVQAGKYFVRPRYEVFSAGGRRRIAHANVERTDLKPDPNIPGLAATMGKGFLLPAPVLPVQRWRSVVLPTPMATTQRDLPLQLIVYDANGEEALRHPYGRLQRSDSVALEVGELLAQSATALPSGYGHLELTYAFEHGGEADGWLHALFRYEDRDTGHGAETSFGSHIFNTVVTYKSEPQSYHGRPPGLSTRLFLRLGPPGVDTVCHLIYPASMPWHPASSTRLVLYSAAGEEVAQREVQIPCSGSLLWRAGDMFDAGELGQAVGGYVIVRDLSCRLFGYHGLIRDGAAFCLDHMFGF